MHGAGGCWLRYVHQGCIGHALVQALQLEAGVT